MKIHKLLKLVEKAIHPTVPPGEAKVALGMLNRALNDAGQTLSDLIDDLVEDESKRYRPFQTATAKQYRERLSALEAEKTVAEAERDIAIAVAEEATAAVERLTAQSAELQTNNAALAARVEAQTTRIEELSEPARLHADLVVESMRKKERIAELEAKVAEVMLDGSAATLEMTRSLFAMSEERSATPTSHDADATVTAAATVEIGSSDAPPKQTWPQRAVARARELASAGRSLRAIVGTMLKDFQMRVSSSEVREHTRWRPDAQGYCWAPAS